MGEASTPVVPIDVLEGAMGELGESVCDVIGRSLQLRTEKRMSTSDVRCLLHSMSWQSPTLKSYFEDRASRRSISDDDGRFEQMSPADMLALTASAGEKENRSKLGIETDAQLEMDADSGALNHAEVDLLTQGWAMQSFRVTNGTPPRDAKNMAITKTSSSKLSFRACS